MKTAVYLIYDEPMGEKLERCHAPDKSVLVGSGDGNECTAKGICPQVEPAYDFKQEQKRRKLDWSMVLLVVADWWIIVSDSGLLVLFIG